jgi:hypothetical protein
MALDFLAGIQPSRAKEMRPHLLVFPSGPKAPHGKICDTIGCGRPCRGRAFCGECAEQIKALEAWEAKKRSRVWRRLSSKYAQWFRDLGMCGCALIVVACCLFGEFLYFVGVVSVPTNRNAVGGINIRGSRESVDIALPRGGA